jgi:hypothetical protein
MNGTSMEHQWNIIPLDLHINVMVCILFAKEEGDATTKPRCKTMRNASFIHSFMLDRNLKIQKTRGDMTIRCTPTHHVRHERNYTAVAPKSPDIVVPEM